MEEGTACARASVCRGSLEAPGGKPTEREKDGTELTCSHGVLWHRAHTYSRKRVLWHRTYTLVPSTHMMAASTCTYSHRVLQERSSRQASHLLSELERQRSAIGAYELTYLELRARGRERAQRWVVRHRRAAAEEVLTEWIRFVRLVCAARVRSRLGLRWSVSGSSSDLGFRVSGFGFKVWLICVQTLKGCAMWCSKTAVRDEARGMELRVGGRDALTSTPARACACMCVSCARTIFWVIG
jgi:hypothetical protein